MTKFKKIAGGSKTAGRRARMAVAVLLGTAVLGLGGPALADRPPAGGLFADAFTWLEPPAPAPGTAFQDADGRATSLEAFRGRVVLLNFWATWCAPCIREMPSLDRLQAKLGGEGLTVAAVSEDFAGLEVVTPFFKRLGLANLEVYLDPDGTLSRAAGIAGLPTTLLIDREGRLVGGLEGPAECTGSGGRKELYGIDRGEAETWPRFQSTPHLKICVQIADAVHI